MRICQNNKGFTLLELLIVSVMFAFIISITGTLLLTGLRNYNDNFERVSGQNSVRMTMLDISRELRAASPSDVVIGTGGDSITIDSKTYTYDSSSQTLTLTDGINPSETVSTGLTSFDASRTGNTVIINTRAEWNDSEITTKVTLRSIPRPTPTA